MAGLGGDWEPVVAVYPDPGFFEGLSINPLGSLGVSGLEETAGMLLDLQGPLCVMQPVVVE
jgi:hypothetical protein